MIQETETSSIYSPSVLAPFARIKGMLLINVAQPGHYAVLESDDVTARRQRLGKPYAHPWESHSYPGRAAPALGLLPNAHVMVPDTDGMGRFLSAFHDVREHYNLGTPIEAILVPWNLHKPPASLDHAILHNSSAVAAHLRRILRQNQHQPITVVTHATTPDTKAWIAAIQDDHTGNPNDNLDVSPLFQEKAGERPSYGYRHGFASYRLGEDPRSTFTAQNRIPAAPGIIAYSEVEARRAYELVADFSGSHAVYTKLDESGGGVYLGRDTSVDAVAKRVNDWKEKGKLDAIFDHATPVEIQAAIPGIVTIGSWQYVGNEIVTPGPGYTTQVVEGTVWQGNIYNDPRLQGVPEEQQEDVQRLIYIMQQRFMDGISKEPEADGLPVGGVDFAIAQISQMDNPEVFIPADLLAYAIQNHIDYMPVAIEHNGLRASDALWPALFAEQLRIKGPFRTGYVSPVTSDLREAWKFMRDHNMQYTEATGQGIVPMTWIHDDETAIHSGMVLVVGKRAEDLSDIYSHAVTALRAGNIIGEADSPENV